VKTRCHANLGIWWQGLGESSETDWYEVLPPSSR
jgi:hypothetical protein